MENSLTVNAHASVGRRKRWDLIRAWMVGSAVFAASLVLPGTVEEGKAEVSVNIGINTPPLPAYVVPAPPPVVVIPGTYVYFAPGLAVDILFYHGYWFRPYGDRWYRSRSYNGPWGRLEPGRVPHALVALPPHYRHIDPAYRHIPYGQVKRNWGRWERERYWDKHRERHQNPGRRYGSGPGHREWDGGERGFGHHEPGRHGGR